VGGLLSIEQLTKPKEKKRKEKKRKEKKRKEKKRRVDNVGPPLVEFVLHKAREDPQVPVPPRPLVGFQ
jgi:hypothetical protein